MVIMRKALTDGNTTLTCAKVEDKYRALIHETGSEPYDYWKILPEFEDWYNDLPEEKKQELITDLCIEYMATLEEYELFTIIEIQ